MVKWNDENTKYLWGWEEKSEHLSTAIKNVKWYHCFCKTVWQFLIHSQILRSFFKKCKNSPNIHHVDRYILVYISIMKYSVQFSLSVVSDSLRPREPQRLRASLSITRVITSCHPGVHPNPCPSIWWCHPIISISVIPFSSCPRSFPASGSFQMSQRFTSGGQSIGVSASASILPINTKDWSPLGWTGWISLQFKGLSRASSPTPQFKSISSLVLSFLYSPTLISTHDHGENHIFD